MKHCSIKDVPVDYRKNYKKMFLNMLGFIGVSLITAIFACWMVWMA